MRPTVACLLPMLLVPAHSSMGASAAVVQQRLGPFEVFFDYDSGRVTPQAQAVLDNVASAYLALARGQPITLSGHTDDTLPPVRAMAMSRVRANAVRNYLVRKGIPAAAITLEGFGATRPYVVVRGRREPLNRRVEIRIGASTAW